MSAPTPFSRLTVPTARAGVKAVAGHGRRCPLPVAVRVCPHWLGRHAGAGGRTRHPSRPSTHLVLLLSDENADQTSSQVCSGGAVSAYVAVCCMRCDWVILMWYLLTSRSAWKRLVPFLPVWSARNIQPGNSVATLASAEQKLGQPLPFELWELYRYRNGQTEMAGIPVHFVEGSRFARYNQSAQKGATHTKQVPSLPCLSLAADRVQRGVTAQKLLPCTPMSSSCMRRLEEAVEHAFRPRCAANSELGPQDK